MEDIDFRKLGAAKLVICPARDVEAGVESGSAEYLVYMTAGEVKADLDGEFPDLSGDVDSGKFTAMLGKAVSDYVGWCGRFHYLQKPCNIFTETGSKFMPSYRYRVALWVDSRDGGYAFVFMPLRASGTVRAAEVSPGAKEIIVQEAET